MVNTSKILTVSYGTFSCTLEGFDDSFDMMKAIAEYFRDLAADDRYFGAEPPTPDADMLARIAEREVSRRVEARHERGAIVLRPSPQPDAEVETAEVQADMVQAAEIEAKEPAAEAVADAPVESPVDQPAAAEIPNEIQDMDDAPFVEEVEEETAEALEVAEPEVEDIEEEAEEVLIAAPAPVQAPAAPQFDEDSVAAKLSRIRAVVSRAAEPAPAAPAYSEDEHAGDMSDASAASIAAALRDTADLADDYEEDEDPFEDVAELPAEDPQLAADIAESTAPELAEPQEAPRTPQRARVIRMKRTDFDAALAGGQLAEDDAKPAPAALSDEDEDALMRELAEVEAELNLAADLPGADQDDALEEDDLPSIFAEEPVPQNVEKADKPKPRPAPVAGAAKAETDVGRLMDKASAEMDRPEGAHRRSAIAHLRAAVQATRAETEAGGGLNRGDDSLDAYRDDLNSVVRPRRPRSAIQAAAPADDQPRRPAMKPAPLKLVAEQRVDAQTPAQPQVVRPRRVSLADIQEDPAPTPAVEDADSFADFAEKAGVKDLSELMEAAAAYMSYVEGRQKFSRPQLMNKARQIEEYQFSREDGLRSFGQLLRQGKIEKLKGGRFTVSDELIGFKPDSRAAG